MIACEIPPLVTVLARKSFGSRPRARNVSCFPRSNHQCRVHVMRRSNLVCLVVIDGELESPMRRRFCVQSTAEGFSRLFSSLCFRTTPTSEKGPDCRDRGDRKARMGRTFRWHGRTGSRFFSLNQSMMAPWARPRTIVAATTTCTVAPSRSPHLDGDQRGRGITMWPWLMHNFPVRGSERSIGGETAS